MLDTLLAVGFLVVGLGGATAAIVRTNAARTKRQELVQQLAERRGGTVAVTTSTAQLKLRAHELDVFVELYKEEAQPEAARWYVVLPPPGTVSFSIQPEGIGTSLTKALGYRDLEVGIPDFDAHFAVRSPDGAGFRRLWTPERCATLLAAFPRARVVGDELRIELDRMGRPSLDELERGLDLVVELATIDVFGLAALRALPDASYRVGLDTEGMPYAELPGADGIRVGPVRKDKIVVTRARSTTNLSTEPAPIEIREGQLAPKDLERLPERVHASVHELGTARLEATDQGVAITWDGIEEDPRRLEAAIVVLRMLASAPPDGIFR